MCRVLKILQTYLSRILFVLHGVLMVWCVVEAKCNHIYWLLLIGVALLGLEMVITVKCVCIGKWKRFSPTVFLYLTTMIPSIWFLELELFNIRKNVPTCQTSSFSILSSQVEFQKMADILEQTMFIVLILGRWLMPKGTLSRDQLSQLLMVYVSLSVDILNISETFKKSEMKSDYIFIIIGLSLFTWAVMKFPFLKGKINSKSTKSKTSPCSEICKLLLTDGIQESSFLVFRVYLIAKEKDPKQDSIFFLCKNIIVIMLVAYRIGRLCCGDKCEGAESSSQDAEDE